ncbi:MULTISPECIES: cytochrome c-type biogenesis protein [unclassified Agarivorans]|uniref:cytochrome c-type biogenesis protein n=1 Tax=unclassified Agarivorans TaxID=2636026 RepID=UPI003D7ED6DF
MRLRQAFHLILLVMLPQFAMAAIEVHEFDSVQQETLFRELTQELRCPKCQNNNIADSNAGLAQDLREKTYQMVKAGRSKQQVLDYMVARYGNFVRYDPPLTPAVLLLWLAPAFIIIFGCFTIWRLARRKPAPVVDLDEQEQKRLAELIKQTERESE